MEQPTEENVVNLLTICGGAAVELFQHEFEKVIENILDANTDDVTRREILVKVVIKPDKHEPTRADYTVFVNSKLCPINPASSQMYFGKRNGKYLAVEHDPRQIKMFDDKKSVASFPSA